MPLLFGDYIKGSVTSGIAILNLLSNSEVITSSQLIHRVATTNKTSPENARQIVRRQSGQNGVWRSDKLILPGGGRLFARTGFRASDSFLPAVVAILEQHRPTLARLIKHISKTRTLLRSHAELLLATPILTEKAKFPAYDNEVQSLRELGVSVVEGKDSVLERLTSPELLNSAQSHALALRYHAQLTAEVAIARILMGELSRENIVAWNTKALDGNSALLKSFNNFRFVDTGFSHLYPLVRINQDGRRIPTPVVMDVCARDCTLEDVQSFNERIARAGANKTTQLIILGIIAAYDFEFAAWETAKKLGYIAINLKQHFGDSAFEALVQIQALLQNVAGEPNKAAPKDYDKLTHYLKDLKTNPYVVDLRSLGFEALAGFILRTEGWEDVQLNIKAATSNGDSREVDVSGKRNGGRELYVVECKAEGINKKLDPSYVRKFFNETLRAFLRSRTGTPLRACHAEIWTTGQIGEDAKKAFSEIKAELKPYIKPLLVGHDAVKDKIPDSLGSCKRLLEAISAGD